MNRPSLFDVPPAPVAVSGSMGEHPSAPAGGTSSWQAVLDFEAAHEGWSAHRKATAIRVDLGLSPTRYHMALTRALDLPESATYAPMLVARLQRLRDQRRTLRTAGRLR